MDRAIAIFVILGSTLWAPAESAQAAAAKCTRTELQAAVDSYLAAVKKGNPSGLPLAPKAKYTENIKEIPIDQGLLQSALDIDFHRSLLDVEACETF
jgi:hypothetical protein